MGFSSSSSSSCLGNSPLSLKITKPWCDVRHGQRFSLSTRRLETSLSGQAANGLKADGLRNWSFITGSRIVIKPKIAEVDLSNKDHRVHASWLVNAPQIASNAFSVGTIAVLPFYGLMVFAPKAELTKKSMQSQIPYVVLGLLYAYLLYLSWTPETVQLIFASKYWLPELPAISKMFSSEMTLASAWIHLLVVDLFAARQVFHDGLENQIETRHSVSLCLFFCPIGILIHAITKALTRKDGAPKHGLIRKIQFKKQVKRLKTRNRQPKNSTIRDMSLLYRIGRDHKPKIRFADWDINSKNQYTNGECFKFLSAKNPRIKERLQNKLYK